LGAGHSGTAGEGEGVKEKEGEGEKEREVTGIVSDEESDSDGGVALYEVPKEKNAIR
jgi:hypothetical protein